MNLVGRALDNGKYRITARLGAGGFGSVWKAEEPALKREVAIKVLHESMAVDESIVERFRREGEAIARLEHPNIVRVYGYGFEEGLHYLVTNLLHGTVRERLAAGPLPLADILRIATDVASALALAHERGIVHRDIKPGNIMFDSQGNAVLTDFGLVCGGGFAQLTVSNAFMGSPPYMSPEQVSPSLGEIDPRSDLYSLGCVLFEFASGRTPFHGQDPFQVANQHVNDSPPRLEAVAPRADAALSKAVARLLEKKPEARFPSAAALHEELRRIAQKSGVTVRPLATARAAEAAGAGAAGAAAAAGGTAPGATPADHTRTFAGGSGSRRGLDLRALAPAKKFLPIAAVLLVAGIVGIRYGTGAFDRSAERAGERARAGESRADAERASGGPESGTALDQAPAATIPAGTTPATTAATMPADTNRAPAIDAKATPASGTKPAASDAARPAPTDTTARRPKPAARNGTLVVRVADAAGALLYPALRVRDAAGREYKQGDDPFVATDLISLPPGQYSVRILDPTLRLLEGPIQPISIGEDEKKVVEFKVQR